MIHIRAMTPEDHVVLRETRLRALQDAPMAFGSTYAKESPLTGQQWAERAVQWTQAGQSCAFLAFDDASGSCCGIVASFKDREAPGRVDIISMWVAAEVRRHGLGRRLIDSVEHWARREDAMELRLNATETNQPAIELYKRCGFEMTGETEPYPNAPGLIEFVMVKRLR